MGKEKNGPARRLTSGILLGIGVLCMATGFAACQTGTTSASGGGTPPAVTDATVSFCDTGDGGCTPAVEFSVESLRDLMVNVNWENLTPGNHMQLLEILQPGGGLYQSSRSSFLVEDASQSSMKVTRTLPVAGTWISQRQITGEWSVRVSLDGKAITTQSVRLDP